MVTRRLGIPAQHHPNITFYTIVPPPHMFFNTEPATVKEILKLIFLLLANSPMFQAKETSAQTHSLYTFAKYL